MPWPRASDVPMELDQAQFTFPGLYAADGVGVPGQVWGDA